VLINGQDMNISVVQKDQNKSEIWDGKNEIVLRRCKELSGKSHIRSIHWRRKTGGVRLLIATQEGWRAGKKWGQIVSEY
jgi:hypothetical protein